MSNIHALAERCLFQPAVEDKLAATRVAWSDQENGRLDLTSHGVVRPIADAAFPERPLRVDPRQVPQRKLTTLEGRVALLHALAHIEFTAIQLAWDILYRFRDMPDQFRIDWLGVAEEEGRHFDMLRQRLRELGADYGDLPAHGGLWQVATDTQDDVLARLALVPRCMEARGLDVTPAMIEKLERVGDQASADHLKIILRDEVGHVTLGSRWFHWECRRRGVEPEDAYFGLLRRHLKGGLRGPFNREARLAAGFSERELSVLDQQG
ncbi:ferritin-like domain-containing protein [Methylogaea oryzae]|uniref:ferritin-like domain-containing protein n=1 Tax=Methylogaea oryzae TaxID=1295382 RepID=UPI0006D23CA7|nr:ferritin-like domain-containing protein [Methylogaea oryzae]